MVNEAVNERAMLLLYLKGTHMKLSLVSVLFSRLRDSVCQEYEVMSNYITHRVSLDLMQVNSCDVC